MDYKKKKYTDISLIAQLGKTLNWTPPRGEARVPNQCVRVLLMNTAGD